MNTTNKIKTLLQLLKNEVNIPIEFGIYTGKKREFGVYVYGTTNTNCADNIQNINIINVQITFYTENDEMELKDNLICFLISKGYLVEDTLYTSIDEVTKLKTFALKIVIE